MVNGSFCFQIFNQFQIAVICSSYYQSENFASVSGSTILVCRFPRLLLNVGQYHLRTWLQEAVHGGEIYETLDGICAFEVVRVDQTQFEGWRPEICTYHENHVWSAIDAVWSDDTNISRDISRRQSPDSKRLDSQMRV
jgi:hypothetical protein